MIPRFASSLIAGVLITFSLLWLMQVLIATGKKALVDEAEFTLGDFIRVEREEIVQRDEDEPEPPPEVDQPPPETPDTQMDDMDTSQALTMGGAAGKIDISMQGGNIGLGGHHVAFSFAISQQPCYLGVARITHYDNGIALLNVFLNKFLDPDNVRAGGVDHRVTAG